jgi:two-component system sensor histidine kinase YcbA
MTNGEQNQGSMSKWLSGISFSHKSSVVFASAIAMGLAAQINISLFVSGFRISIAVVLLAVLSYLIGRFPLRTAASLSAVSIFISRLLIAWLAGGKVMEAAAAYAPEMVFYPIYGLLLFEYKKRYRMNRLISVVPLAGMDFICNTAEIVVRLGGEGFSPEILLRLMAVALMRAMMIVGIIIALDFYSFKIMRREDAHRMNKLMLLASKLKSEVVWMDKNAKLIESTMNTAYDLYQRLGGEAFNQAKARAEALDIARDIHEVKKDYYLIMRGIEDALEENFGSDAMSYFALLDLLRDTLSREAEKLGLQVRFEFERQYNFMTRTHYALLSIFRNLLINALEAAQEQSITERGERTFTIGIRQWTQPQRLGFQVWDDCGGIPVEDLKNLFVPGFSTKINYETGAIQRGLGLSIVKDLVEQQLLGTLTVESRDGRTVFELDVPKQALEVKA